MRALQVGDVLRYSWGYDQTNVNAFAVVRATKASVWLQPIRTEGVPGSEGFMSRRVRPCPDQPIEGARVIRKRRQVGWKGDEEICRMPYGVAVLWPEGEGTSETSYA